MNKDWSIDLEHGDYEKNMAFVIEDGLKAIEETESGYYVNLVTPSTFGNPIDYLSEIIDSHFNQSVSYKFIDQCGCGGYVLRVWKR
ncbi:CGCGG family putative rSAM-modified RiPP protein [Ferdinandcohnia quinoae]|uniref:CGCGG family rSAM-modified RiPP protein n=1 Tax=Fredinandcohnia quinoae TaxID=2918902 RepID=A0AAW5E664_9BACI|nr:CGCGG family rSAM-modified RiPP protein [Fredinandcohnia sp. SECRCQ15]MCH1626359.1 CGCGG family rSAM-modified RiPP protein [Fredinandcohnia sp. SECRCQ15]